MDGIWLPRALWEETRLGGRYRLMKANQLKAFGVLSAHLCMPLFVVEVNEDATVFIVHDVLHPGWTREMDRAEMKRFVESQGPRTMPRRRPHAETAESDPASCIVCNKLLTPGRRIWCESEAGQRAVGGRLICFDCQEAEAEKTSQEQAK